MKFRKILIVFSLTLCILFGASFVAASDSNDTIVANDANDTIIASDANEDEIAISDETQVTEQSNDDLIAASNDGNFTELQIKILLAPDGATINLDKDYSYNDNFLNGTGILINKNLIIDGHGHTIDGKSKSRIFTIFYGLKNNNNVVLKNIIFQNGYAKIYGGAILSFANLKIENCIFTNNYAKTAGGAVNSLGSLNVTNSKFYKNSAGGDAGAIFSLNLEIGVDIFKSSNISSDPTSLSDLITAVGLNTTLKHGKDYISNCIFTSNVAGGTGGGAIYAFSHIDISSCTFISNKAGKKGAAVFGCKDLYIKNSNFNKNKAGMYGGAVYFKCHEQTGHYEKGTWVSSIKFYTNLIQNSVFANNVAGERGGAIYGFKLSDSDIHCAKAVKCTFSDNKAPKGKDIYGGTLSKCVYKNTVITIKKVPVKKSVKKLVLTATLKKGSTPLKYKTVTFKFNGKTYKAKTNSRGIAKYTIKKSVLNKLKVNKIITYSASYGSFIAKRTAKVNA